MENKSGDKLLTIFEYVVLQEEPLRLIDISNGLGLNRATALRFLTTLVNKGYVDQDPKTLRYRPTYKICALAGHVNVHEKLREAAHPLLERIAGEFRETVNISVESGMRAVYIDVVQGLDRSLITFQQIGSASPMHCTGNGKLLLLNYSDEQLDELIRVRGLKQYTEHTFTTKEALKGELRRIRERGYAYDEEEREPGIRCIAFPVYGADGKVIAGVSVSGPKERMTDEHIGAHLGFLREAVEELTKKLNQ